MGAGGPYQLPARITTRLPLVALATRLPEKAVDLQEAPERASCILMRLERLEISKVWAADGTGEQRVQPVLQLRPGFVCLISRGLNHNAVLCPENEEIFKFEYSFHKCSKKELRQANNWDPLNHAS